MIPAVALLAALLVAAGVAALATAFSPKKPPRPRTAKPANRYFPRSQVIAAMLVGVVLLVATSWPIAALAAAALVLSWRWLFTSDASAEDRKKVQAIAKWLEDLRDVVRRSSVGIEAALEIVAEDAQGPLGPGLSTFVRRRRQGVRIGPALAEFADQVEHPLFDSAAAAITLVVDGAAGGARLFDTLDELAGAARDETRAREEIDRIRRIYERAMRRLVVLTAVFIIGLYVFAEDLVEPYRSAAGQAWLVVPCCMWAACLSWLRQLTRYDLGTRYRLRSDEGEYAL
jgi:tight adherence protein B